MYLPYRQAYACGSIELHLHSLICSKQVAQSRSMHVCSTCKYVVAGPEINDVNNGKNSPIECKYMIDAAAGH